MVEHAMRPVGIRCPLGDEVFLLASLDGWEEMSRGFEFTVELFAEDHDVDFDALIGQPFSVRVDRDGQEPRVLHGIVSDFEYLPAVENYARYRARVVPWTWFLSRHTDCRVFQNQTPEEIVLDVFREHGFHDFDVTLEESYDPREYCVQYAETDLQFVNRVLEEAGIATYFRHEDERHVLVLCDALGGAGPISGCEEIPYQPAWEQPRRPETVWDWQIQRRIRPERFAINGFDYENPRKRLLSQSQQANSHGARSGETYEYDPVYRTVEFGEATAKRRLEALQAQYEVVRAVSNARSVVPGGTFTLLDPPREDQAREYLVIQAHYRILSNVIESEERESVDQDLFEVRIAGIDAAVRYRPIRETPKPRISGPQTAWVVGPEGEEIWTDSLGRVKVQFHWDRLGGLDENSSCWVRVAQQSAGRGWGDFRLPRIGQEVVVEFLEGDPDAPIVTGSVYNGTHAPPYDMAENKTQWGTKTCSTDTTGGFNEFRFDDKSGAEQVFLRSERDYDERVGNNSRRQVEHNDDHTIGGDERLLVGGSEHRTIDGDSFEQVGASKQTHVGGEEVRKVDSNFLFGVDGDRTEEVGGAMNVSAGGGMKFEAPTIDFEAQSEIRLKCGGSSIVMTPGGVTIESPSIELKADGCAIRGGTTMIVASTATIDATSTTVTNMTKIDGPLLVEQSVLVKQMLTAMGSVNTPSVASPLYTPGAGNVM